MRQHSLLQCFSPGPLEDIFIFPCCRIPWCEISGAIHFAEQGSILSVILNSSFLALRHPQNPLPSSREPSSTLLSLLTLNLSCSDVTIPHTEFLFDLHLHRSNHTFLKILATPLLIKCLYKYFISRILLTIIGALANYLK